MTTVFSDNFNRADGALGAGWSTFAGTPSAAVASNKMALTHTGVDYAIKVAGVSVQNGAIDLDLTQIGTDQETNFFYRAQDASNYYWVEIYRGGGSNIYAGWHKMVAGVTTALANSGFVLPGQFSGEKHLTIAFLNDTLTVTFNGTEVLSATDAGNVFPAAGSVGVIYVASDTTDATIDNFVLDDADAAPTPPTVTAIAIPVAGATVVLTASEALTAGTGGSGGITLSATGGAVTATYSSGSGTTSLVYSLSRTLSQTETVTCSYTQPGDGWETSGGTDLATFAGAAVTNHAIDAPSDLAVVSVTSSAINLSFTDNGTADGITISVSANADFSGETLTNVNWADIATAAAQGLTEGVLYYVRVRKWNAPNATSDDWSDWSNTVTATPAAGVTGPVITNVTIPNITMKIGDVVPVTITVDTDADDYTAGSGGLVTSTIGGFTLGALAKVNDTTYTATFTVTSGGTDVPAASSIPVSVTLKNSAGDAGVEYTTAIVQNADRIDANRPTIIAVSIPNAPMVTGDTVTATITVGDDGGDTYTLGASNVGGYGLGSLSRTNATTYTATFTVGRGGANYLAAADIPVSVVMVDSAGNASAAFTTAISQNADSITSDPSTAVAHLPLDLSLRL